MITYLQTYKAQGRGDYGKKRAEAYDYALEADEVFLYRLNPPGVEGPVLYVPDGLYTGPALDHTVSRKDIVSKKNLDSRRYHESPPAMWAQLEGFAWWPEMLENIGSYQSWRKECAGHSKPQAILA